MSLRRMKGPLLALVCGLCLSLHGGANAQAPVETFSVPVPRAIEIAPLEGVPLEQGAPAAATAPADPVSAPPAAPATMSAPPAPQAPGPHAAPALPARPASGFEARVALLLPLRSPALGAAAESVRAGFLAAHEREPGGLSITFVETGDTPQDVLNGYRRAAETHDIVVGPLSRTGVTAVARSGEVLRPTIALNSPEAADGEVVRLPPLMLPIGLSIEDEARQVADWARRDHATSVAYVLHTRTAWQRRAARAFASHWQRSGMAARTLELDVADGFLNAAALVRLKAALDNEPSAFVFAALDAWQARQLRESVGRQFPMYGTSQLNPVALPDRHAAEPVIEMEGAQLLDIPWQLLPDHPAVMVYPRPVVDADQRRNADLERLYALGIDAYRIARELAARQTNFELDGVTGHLVVRFDRFGPYFERTVPQAVYRGGTVTATTSSGPARR